MRPFLTTRPTSPKQNIDINLQTLADEAGVFSFAQFSVSPFVQRVENKKLLKNGNKIGVFVGYHLKATTQTQGKFSKNFFKRPLIFPLQNSESVKGLSEIDRQKYFSRKFQNLFQNPLINRP